jgi:hypothetical protein
MSQMGRKGDSMLVHMAPEEVSGLQQLALAHGGSLTINPQTGLYEASFLKKLLPTLIGAGLMFIPGVNALAAAAMVGGGYGLAKGSLKEGLMAGLQAYGGASLAGGLGAGSVFGKAATTAALPSAAAADFAATSAGYTGAAAANTAGAALPAIAPAAVAAPAAAAPATFGAKFAANPMVQGFNKAYGNFGNAAAGATYANPTPILTGLPAKIGTGLATSGLMSGIGGAMTPSAPNFASVMNNKEIPYEEYEMAPQNVSYSAPGQGSSGQLYFSKPVFRPKRKPTPQANYADTFDINQGYASGGIALKDGSFIVDARTVSELGNGSSRAGQEVLARHGGQPIQGKGDGVSDSIRANIGGVQEARVARDEVKFGPEAVARIGRGNPKRGAQRLYALMDRAHKARKHADRGEDTKLRGLMAAR